MKSLESSLSLVKSSTEIGISEPTVFSWRHKFLSLSASFPKEREIENLYEV